MEHLSGKVAVITGAGSGIGLALARRFVGEGMHIVLADVEEPALAAAAAQVGALGAETLAVPTDVSALADVEALAAAALDRFGAVHLVCNNAGVGGAGPAWDLALWRWVIDVNLWGVVHGVHTFLPILREQGEGHIVNTASWAGIVPGVVGPAYIASKHAVVGLTERLFHELAGSGIGVSVVCPSVVTTQIVNAERNWPAELGPVPTDALNPEEQEILDLFRAVLEADGIDPAEVADAVLEAVTAPRFWVLTHKDRLPHAIDRLRRAGEGLDPLL